MKTKGNCQSRKFQTKHDFKAMSLFLVSWPDIHQTFYQKGIGSLIVTGAQIMYRLADQQIQFVEKHNKPRPFAYHDKNI